VTEPWNYGLDSGNLPHIAVICLNSGSWVIVICPDNMNRDVLWYISNQRYVDMCVYIWYMIYIYTYIHIYIYTYIHIYIYTYIHIRIYEIIVKRSSNYHPRCILFRIFLRGAVNIVWVVLLYPHCITIPTYGYLHPEFLEFVHENSLIIYFGGSHCFPWFSGRVYTHTRRCRTLPKFRMETV
jgi:hypothetical protein